MAQGDCRGLGHLKKEAAGRLSLLESSADRQGRASPVSMRQQAKGHTNQETGLASQKRENGTPPNRSERTSGADDQKVRMISGLGTHVAVSVFHKPLPHFSNYLPPLRIPQHLHLHPLRFIQVAPRLDLFRAHCCLAITWRYPLIAPRKRSPTWYDCEAIWRPQRAMCCLE